MLTTVRGRVEADPLRIPAPTRTDAGGSAFAAVLDQVAQDRPVAEVESREPEPRDEQAEVTDTPVDARADELPAEAPQDSGVDDAAGGEADASDDLSSHGNVGNPDVTETLRRGESERREDAGKGTDSPRTSSSKAATAEPLLAAVVQRSGNEPVLTGSVGTTDGKVSAVASAKTGEAPTRGIDAGAVRSNAAVRAAAVTPGYRTTNVANAELLEQARDSVFKQILMQLDTDGGEMRVRLQPPDLGELDLRLVVEHGNKLSLTIAAERADLTLLLQKHLGELKQTLQASGLEITDAQVHQRAAGGDRDDGGFYRDRRGAQPTADVPAPAPMRRGYVSAEGLDFWA